jgi:geranylgeranyl reductase family protein
VRTARIFVKAEETFDALIVGAGPAGSFAAEKLARGGARVALFDGRPAGEAKACGGGVTSKALKAWPFLLEAGGRAVTEVEMLSPSGGRVRLELAEPFAIYSRRALDSYMTERARRAGARVFECRVTASTERDERGRWVVRAKNGESWAGGVLVAADGANSAIAKRLAGALPNSEMEVAFGYRTPLDEADEAPTVIAFLPGWAGYAWAFPRLDHISFGIATSQDEFNHRALDNLLWKFMVSYYRLTEYTKTGDGKIEERLRAIAKRYAARIPKLTPKMWDKRQTVGENWALLGDAAGFADPITGEGIYYALRSAELLAKAYLHGQLTNYNGMWRDDFGCELRRAASIRYRFYSNFLGGLFTERMIKFAHLHPGIQSVLQELVTGEQSYIKLKHKLICRAVWPF